MPEVREVRRPVRANTPLVRDVLDRLELAGVSWAPRFLRLDGDEEVLSWLPGAPLEYWGSAARRLDDLALMVRQLHDLTTDLAGGSECVVHDDLQPRNVVVERGHIGLIDWEQLRPGHRVEDVAQLCWSFAGPGDDEAPHEVAARWRRVLDSYALTDRGQVVDVAMTKIERCMDDISRRSESGSVRHRRMKARGDREDLEATLAWLRRHGTGLSSEIG